MKAKKIILTILLSIIMLLGACGSDGSSSADKEQAYHDGITKFKNDISATAVRMDSIDASSETAGTELLSCLDEMKTHFEELQALSVPDSYNGAKGLAVQASTAMSNAVSMYHELYSAEQFDYELSQKAKQEYDSAMAYVDSIGALIVNYSSK